MSSSERPPGTPERKSSLKRHRKESADLDWKPKRGGLTVAEFWRICRRRNDLAIRAAQHHIGRGTLGNLGEEISPKARGPAVAPEAFLVLAQATARALTGALTVTFVRAPLVLSAMARGRSEPTQPFQFWLFFFMRFVS